VSSCQENVRGVLDRASGGSSLAPLFRRAWAGAPAASPWPAFLRLDRIWSEETTLNEQGRLADVDVLHPADKSRMLRPPCTPRNNSSNF